MKQGSCWGRLFGAGSSPGSRVDAGRAGANAWRVWYDFLVRRQGWISIKVKVISFYTKKIETTVEIPIGELKTAEDGLYEWDEISAVATLHAQNEVYRADPDLRLQDVDEVEIVSAPIDFELWL